MPLPASDDFNRADGAPGANWSSNSGTLAIFSQSAIGNGNGRAMRWNADTFGNSQYSQGTLVNLTSSFSSNIGVAVRMSTSGANTWYGVRIWNDGTTWVDVCVAGTQTRLHTEIIAWQVGDVVRIEAFGTTIRALRNGSSFFSTTNATLASGSAGLLGSNSVAGDGPRLDNWSGGELAPPSAPTSLIVTGFTDITANISWTDASSDETGFKIERAVGAGAFSEIHTAAANTTQYADTALSPSTDYRYRIRATNAFGDSAYSNTITLTTLPPQIRLTVEIAFANDPFAASPTYVDVTSRVRVDEPIIIKRGRQNELGRVEAGRLSLSLDNRDRALDPLNTSSPYYPNVKARRRIRVSATWNGTTHRLYTGYCRFSNNWGVTDNTCRVDALDALDLFARMPMVEQAITVWSPVTALTTISTAVSHQLDGTGRIRIKLASAPSGTQTITVTGTDRSGAVVVDIIAVTSSNWSAGADGTVAFYTLTQLQSDNASGTHRAMTFSHIPAYRGAVTATSDEHILALLEYAKYPSGLMQLNQGVIVMEVWAAIQATEWSANMVSSGADTVLSGLQRVTDTESGLFYVKGDGTFVYEGMDIRASSYFANLPVLGSGTGEIPYRDAALDDGDAFVANQIRIEKSGARSGIADATGAEIAEYGRRPLTRSGNLSFNLAFRQKIASYLLYHRKAAVPRVTSLTIDADATNYSTVLGWDISTPVTVRLRPPGGAAVTYDKPSWVESLEWRITRSAWTLKLGLSPMELGNDLLRSISGAGMSFPASPYLDQVFYRQDLDLLCYWDGTRWLTVNEYVADFQPWGGAPPFSAAGATFLSPRHSDYNVYITRAYYASLVNTTNNGTNYWGITLQVDATTIWSSNTSAHTAATINNVNQNVNTAYTPTGYFWWNMSKTGTPGTLQFTGTFRYRLIVT